jgi:hypothetical protein
VMFVPHCEDVSILSSMKEKREGNIKERGEVREVCREDLFPRSRDRVCPLLARCEMCHC